MARPTTLMIAVGLGRPHGDAQDEDGLDRKRDNGGGDDVATEAIASIVDRLKHSKASAVRDIRLFADALAELCDAFMARDYHRVGDAASEARDRLHDLISDE